MGQGHKNQAQGQDQGTQHSARSGPLFEKKDPHGAARRKTQKKNSMGQFPFLATRFQEEWRKAEARTRRMLTGVKPWLILSGFGENSS